MSDGKLDDRYVTKRGVIILVVILLVGFIAFKVYTNYQDNRNASRQACELQRRAGTIEDWCKQMFPGTFDQR